MSSWLARVLGLSTARRSAALDDRAAVVLLFARAVDEVCSGLLVVLMPTLRARLGLTVQQVGWCFQALTSVAGVVEPITGVAIDHVRRRPLLMLGAAGWGAALVVAAVAPGFWWLLSAFALVGLTSGALAHTADVVLVESFPLEIERIASRSTWLDTLGALSAPVAIGLTVWAGGEGRLLLVIAGVGALAYALLLLGAGLPPPSRPQDEQRLRGAVRGFTELARDRSARRWLGCLLLFSLLDPVELFEPVWLASSVGVSQRGVALHAVVGLTAALLATAALDRWLERHDAGPVLVASCAASLVLYPAWLLVPGFGAKLVLVAIRDAVSAPLWPILRARALAALPGRGGTASAVTALAGLLPLPALIGWAASRFGLTRSLVAVSVVALAGMLLVARSPDVVDDGVDPAATGRPPAT
jgi:predicted MFS family arabinose efflux permease